MASVLDHIKALPGRAADTFSNAMDKLRGAAVQPGANPASAGAPAPAAAGPAPVSAAAMDAAVEPAVGKPPYDPVKTGTYPQPPVEGQISVDSQGTARTAAQQAAQNQAGKVPDARQMSLRTGATTPGQVIRPTPTSQFSMTGESPLRPAFADPLADSNARVRMANNPYLRTDAGQQAVGRANEMFKGPQPAAAAPVEPVAPAGRMAGLRAGAGRMVGGALRVAAPLALAAGVPDQLQHGATSMDDTIVGELGSPGFSPQSTAAGSGFRAGAGNALSTLRRTGNALSFGLGLGDKVIGGVRDIAKGDLLGTTKFDDGAPAAAPSGNMPPAVRNADVQPGTAQAEMPAVGTAPGRPVPMDDGSRATPDLILQSNNPSLRSADIPRGADNLPLAPADGHGAFRRTTPGNEGPAYAISNKVREAPQDNAGDPSDPRSTVRNGLRAMAGAIPHTLNVKAAQARESGVVKQAELGIKASAAQLALQKYRDDRGDNNRKNVESLITSTAESETPADAASGLLTSGATATAKRADMVKQRGAQLRKELEFSVANRKDGTRVEDLSHQDVQQLLLHRKMRDNVLAGRGEYNQATRDFFGGKRANSDDLYSYAPAKVERATIPGGGGYIVHSRNGNTMTIKAGQGGRFNWISPNDPIDADAAAVIAPYIDAFEKTEAAKRSK